MPALSLRDRLSSLRPRWREWLPPLICALIALLLTLPNLGLQKDTIYPLAGDSVKYDALGKGLARFLGELPTAVGKLLSGGFGPAELERYGFNDWIFQHTPVYGWTLGTVYALTGSAETAGRTLTAFYYAGAALLFWLLARRKLGFIPSVVASACFLLWPAQLYFGTAIMTEVPMLFFALLAAWSLDCTRRSSRSRWVVLGGVALGFLFLSKTTYKMVLLPALLLDLWPRMREKGMLRFLGLRLAGLALAIAPFYAFLGLAHLDPDPLTKAGETALWLYRGNYVPDRGFENVGIGDPLTPELLKANGYLAGVPESDVRRVLYSTAFRLTLREDPVGWVALVLSKFAWFWTYPAWKGDLHFWFGTLAPPSRLQPLLALLALIGLAACVRREKEGLLLALFPLYVSTVHAATHLVSRYNTPVFGLAIPFAVLGAMAIGRAALDVARDRGASWRASLTRGRRIELMLAIALSAAAVLVSRDQLRGMTGSSAPAAQSVAVALDLLALLAWTFFAFRSARRSGVDPARSILAAIAFPGLLAAVAWGLGRDDPDADRFRARLSQAGDRIEQRIELPSGAIDGRTDAAEVCLDLLPSVRPGYALVVRVNGHEAARFDPKLESTEQDFELDRSLFAAQDKWNRVSRAVKREYEDFVQPRHPNAGYEYFRQWYRVPIELAWLDGAQEARIECELASTSGGYVDCFGDGEVKPSGKDRAVAAPVFLVNAFELSSYRFDLFANDRMEADSRLVRTMRLASPSSTGRFYRQGAALKDQSPEPGLQAGEYRIRLRLHQRGTWVQRSVGGRASMIYADSVADGDRPADLNALRRMPIDRDQYFDGWRVY